MTSTKLVLATALTALTLAASPAFSQARPRSGGATGGQAVHAPSVGTAVPRPGYPAGGYPPYGHYPYYPYRPYYPPYYRPYYYPGYNWGLGFYYGYPYGYYPYGSIGFGFGYGYGSIGFGFAYGYPYYGGGPYYVYPGYGYPAYGYPYGGAYVSGGPVAVVPGESYGGVKIQDAPKNAQVYVDGAYVGVVNESDGTFQEMNLQAGTHHIEIHATGFETLSFDVQTQPGQTINYRARMRPSS